jgi:hypothetical protein
MAPIDDAIEEYKLQELGEKLSYAKVAEKYSIPQCTLRKDARALRCVWSP